MALIKEHIAVGDWGFPLCGNRQGRGTNTQTGLTFKEWRREYRKNPENCCKNCTAKIKNILARQGKEL